MNNLQHNLTCNLTQNDWVELKGESMPTLNKGVYLKNSLMIFPQTHKVTSYDKNTIKSVQVLFWGRWLSAEFDFHATHWVLKEKADKLISLALGVEGEGCSHE